MIIVTPTVRYAPADRERQLGSVQHRAGLSGEHHGHLRPGRGRLNSPVSLRPLGPAGKPCHWGRPMLRAASPPFSSAAATQAMSTPSLVRPDQRQRPPVRPSARSLPQSRPLRNKDHLSEKGFEVKKI